MPSAPAPPVALLDAIVRDALDPSYAEAAAHHSGKPAPRRTATGAALIALVGALIGLAVFAQHKTVPEVSSARAALAGDASERNREIQQLQQALTAGQRQLAKAQQDQLQSTAAGRELARQEAALSAAISRSPVSGSGVTLTITDVLASAAPEAGSRPQGQGVAGQVTDRELQALVNGLWAAGAQAVSVGGVRLGPQTAIRTAGQTILVDFTPLQSPYVIAAVGGATFVAAAQRLPVATALASGPAGSHPDVVVRPAGELHLTAVKVAPPTLQARPLTGGHS
jgi:uncharacterized protein YlxW (UPF0749 family)